MILFTNIDASVISIGGPNSYTSLLGIVNGFFWPKKPINLLLWPHQTLLNELLVSDFGDIMINSYLTDSSGEPEKSNLLSGIRMSLTIRLM